MGIEGYYEDYFDERQEKEKLTNFQKIKNMSTDEMAEFLSEVSIRPCNICNAPLCKDGYICSEGWGWWLSRLQEESED